MEYCLALCLANKFCFSINAVHLGICFRKMTSEFFATAILNSTHVFSKHYSLNVLSIAVSSFRVIVLQDHWLIHIEQKCEPVWKEIFLEGD